MPVSLPLALFDAALRGVLIALLLLLAGVLRRDRPHLHASRAGALLALGLCVQVVGATPFVEAWLWWPWQVPLVAVSVGNAVLFWIFVQALFDDDFRWRPVHLGAWLTVAVISGVNCALNAGGDAAPLLARVSLGVQRMVPLVFALLAAGAAASHWRADLVERRRRLRGFIAVSGIGYSVAMLAARLLAPQGRLSAATATIDVAVLLVIVAVVAAGLFRLSGTDLFPARGANARPDTDPAGDRPPPSVEGTTTKAAEAAGPVAPDPAEERLAATLERLMAQERIYRSEDLSVAALAARLAVPEYRLRRLINRRLGHRNFNAFVNGFRLDDARGALSDPARRDVPVLTIALDAGFQSIGPFNRAFKAATGRTPTEYRREMLADS